MEAAEVNVIERTPNPGTGLGELLSREQVLKAQLHLGTVQFQVLANDKENVNPQELLESFDEIGVQERFGFVQRHIRGCPVDTLKTVNEFRVKRCYS